MSTNSFKNEFDYEIKIIAFFIPSIIDYITSNKINLSEKKQKTKISDLDSFIRNHNPFASRFNMHRLFMYTTKSVTLHRSLD